jgi:hypothetical protein
MTFLANMVKTVRTFGAAVIMIDQDLEAFIGVDGRRPSRWPPASTSPPGSSSSTTSAWLIAFGMKRDAAFRLAGHYKMRSCPRTPSSWPGWAATTARQRDGRGPRQRQSGHGLLPAAAPGRRPAADGRPEAAAGWLVRQITHMIAADPGSLVVIDGSSDLVPRLKRQAVVTRLLGKRLAYLDLAGPALSGGFNPLAAVPGENEAARLDRWRRWFEGMGVPSPGLSLLARAMDEGAADIPGLRKWLRRPENRLQQPASAGLVLALNRLAADPDLADWLAWPVNGYDILPAGALFFACRSESWAGQQLLRGVLLAALARPETRLVIHGFPWAAGDVELLVDDLQSPAGDRPVLVSNGPLLPDSTILLGQCSQVGAETLADRFLDADPLLVENLQLLGRHEVLVLGDGSAGRRMVFPAAWPPIQTSAGDSGAAAGGPAAASSPAAGHDGIPSWAPRHQNRTDDRQNP